MTRLYSGRLTRGNPNKRDRTNLPELIVTSVLFKLAQAECYTRSVLTLQDMAEIVGVPVAQLRLWLEAGKITATSTVKNTQVMMGSKTDYFFEEKDIQPIRAFAKRAAPKKQEPNQFVDDGEQENFTVAQIASLWQLSTDTIQRMFQDEPGVLPLGDRNPRGKRKRITLRIPRAVMERVKRKRSNP